MMRWPTPLYRLPHFFISRIKMYGTSCERKDMKTNQIMIRPMGEFKVIQRTKDAFFNATDLLNQWNGFSGQQKQMVHYTDNSSTKEFIKALISEEMFKERNSVLIQSRGKNGCIRYFLLISQCGSTQLSK